MKKRYKCDRCENGLKREYSHIDNGVCWKCNGSGFLKYNPQPTGTLKDDDSLREREITEQFIEEEQQASRDAWMAANNLFDDEEENYYHG